jgi:sterol desaturase/sphingolipid hydroxylase (fatty acid hydroxylase superfamily)
LFGWLTTVTHHDLHHAHAGTNFGLYFTFWDRIMGTEDPNYERAFALASGPHSTDERIAEPRGNRRRA